MNPEERIITWQELSEHAEKTNLWVLIDGRVYDVTSFLAEHPGGDDILIAHGGLDASTRFNKEDHSDYAKSIRNSRLVGLMEDIPQPDDHVSKVRNIKPKAQIPRNPTQQLEWAQIAKHNYKEDLWLAVEGKVYDLTEFQFNHPGGPGILQKNAGTDATTRYLLVNHSSGAKKQMVKYQVGLCEITRQTSNQTKYIMFITGLLLAYFYNQFVKVPTTQLNQ